MAKMLTDAIIASWFPKNKSNSSACSYNVKIVKLNLAKTNKVIKNTFR